MHTSSEATKSEVLQGGGHDQSFDLLKALGLVIQIVFRRIPGHFAEFLMSRYAKRRLASALGLSLPHGAASASASHRVRYRPKDPTASCSPSWWRWPCGGHGGDGPAAAIGAPARVSSLFRVPTLE